MQNTKQLTSTRSRKQKQIDRTHQKVLDGTIEILAEYGYRSLTTEKIATQSGVSRSTIYRHWPSVTNLAMEAFLQILGPTNPPPQTGHVRTDLVLSYKKLIEALLYSKWGNILPAIMEASFQDAEFAKMLHDAFNMRRNKLPRTILEQAVERGDLPEDTNFDWLLDSVTGAIYYRLFFLDKPLEDPGMVEYLVNCAVDGAINLSRKVPADEQTIK